MQAVILVGGKGTRLRPLTDRRPKPMMAVVDRPFVAHQLDHLQRHGVTDVVFSCGYLPDSLREHFGDGSSRGLRIRYAVDPVPLGTAGAVRNALPELDGASATLVLNGDVLTDLDLDAVLAQHRDLGAKGTIVLTPVPDPGPFGLVRLHEDRAVEEFLEKPSPEQLREGEPFRINAGTYVLQPELIDTIPTGVECSIEREIFPRVAAERALYGFPSDAYWLDIGTPEAYLRANEDALAGRVRTASPTGEQFVAATSTLADGAALGVGTVLGAECEVGSGARVRASVIGEGVRVRTGAEITRSVVGAGATIGQDARIGPDVIVGDGAVVADGTRLVGPLKVPTDGLADSQGVREPEHSREARG